MGFIFDFGVCSQRSQKLLIGCQEKGLQVGLTYELISGFADSLLESIAKTPKAWGCLGHAMNMVGCMKHEVMILLEPMTAPSIFLHINYFVKPPKE